MKNKGKILFFGEKKLSLSLFACFEKLFFRLQNGIELIFPQQKISYRDFVLNEFYKPFPKISSIFDSFSKMIC